MCEVADNPQIRVRVVVPGHDDAWCAKDLHGGDLAYFESIGKRREHLMYDFASGFAAQLDMHLRSIRDRDSATREFVSKEVSDEI